MAVVKLSALFVQRRAQTGQTQVQFAALLGISQQALVKWEKGTSAPRTNKLPLVAKVLGLSLDEVCRARALQLNEAVLEDKPPEAPAAAVTGEQPRLSCATATQAGYGLLAKLSRALEKNAPQPYQVEVLAALIESFERGATSRAMCA